MKKTNAKTLAATLAFALALIASPATALACEASFMQGEGLSNVYSGETIPGTSGGAILPTGSGKVTHDRKDVGAPTKGTDELGDSPGGGVEVMGGSADEQEGNGTTDTADPSSLNVIGSSSDRLITGSGTVDLAVRDGVTRIKLNETNVVRVEEGTLLLGRVAEIRESLENLRTVNGAFDDPLYGRVLNIAGGRSVTFGTLRL